MFACNEDYEVMMRMRAEPLISFLYYIDYRLHKNKINNRKK